VLARASSALGLKKVEELVVLAEELFEREHGWRFRYSKAARETKSRSPKVVLFPNAD